jgi:hypothetical protein
MTRWLVMLSALVLAACATPTPYQAATADATYGYSETPIEANRLRIAFKGNSLTDRETVENYLLFRAAEATLAAGYDHFLVADRATDANRRYSSVGPTRPYYGAFFPYWSYYGPFGWRPAYDPFWDDITLREVTRYEASAEILMAKGAKPAGDANAFDAREVVANLGPRIARAPA